MPKHRAGKGQQGLNIIARHIESKWKLVGHGNSREAEGTISKLDIRLIQAQPTMAVTKNLIWYRILSTVLLHINEHTYCSYAQV